MAERLGEAVLELRTDDARLTRGLASARAKAQKLGRDFQAVGARISLYVSAPILGLIGATAKLADTQLKAERQLAAALKFSGGAVENRLAAMKAFASGLQEITTVGDETTLQNLQVAKSMGLADEQARRAAQNAIALAKAYNINETSAIRYTAALEQGDTTMLTRTIPTLKLIEDESTRVAKAQQLLAEAFNIATAEAETGLGPLFQMRNDLGDLGEDLGSNILPAIKDFAGGVREVIGEIRALTPVQKKWLVGLAAALAASGPIVIGLGVVAASIGALLTPIGLVLAAIVGPVGLVAGWTAFHNAVRSSVPKIIKDFDRLDKRLRALDVGGLDLVDPTMLDGLREERRRLEAETTKLRIALAQQAHGGPGSRLVGRDRLPGSLAPPTPPPDPEAVKPFEAMRQSIADVRFEAQLLATGVSEATQEAARAARAAGIVETFDEIAGGSDAVQASMVDFARSFENLRDQEGLASLREKVADLRFESALLSADLPEALEEAARAARGAGLIETFEDLSALSADAQAELALFFDQFDRLENLRAAKQIFEDTRTPLEDYSIEVARLRRQLEAGLISQDTFNRAVAAAKNELEGVSEAQDRTADAANRLGFTFASAFEDAAIAGESLSDVLQGLLEDIQRVILRLAITEPLARAIAGGLTGGGAGGGGLLGALFASGGGLVGRDNIPTIPVPSRLFADAPHFDKGGIVGTGIPAIVHPGEEILPAGHPRHRDNAGGVNVYITAPAGTQPRVDRKRGPGGSVDLHVIIDEAVANAVRQPGSRTRSALESSFGVSHRLIARA